MKYSKEDTQLPDEYLKIFVGLRKKMCGDRYGQWICTLKRHPQYPNAHYYEWADDVPDAG